MSVCVCAWVWAGGCSRVCSEYQCPPYLTGLFHLPAYTLQVPAQSTDKYQAKIFSHLDPDHFQLLIAALRMPLSNVKNTLEIAAQNPITTLQIYGPFPPVKFHGAGRGSAVAAAVQ